MINLCPFCFQPYIGYGSCSHCGHTVGEPRGGAQQLPLGTILDGKYQLGMVLGQGGFGITYLAYDMTLRMRVAIKEYFPLGLVTRQGQTVTFTGGNAQPFFQKGVEAFYREAQLLARFQTHPNIVHVSSFFRQNGTAYFVMEYVEGESLSAYLDRCGGRLSYDETVQLLTPILDALSDVHNAGILHRDIAPDNICLTKDGNVKLLDFGAAKNELSIHTHSSAAILKPGYAPMEQYTAGSNQGPWTDIYAMGAVIYRCLSGVVPPDAPDRIIGQPLLSYKEASVSAPTGAETVINKALALDIQNRWQRVADFRNALIDPSALKNIKPQLQKQEKSQKQISRKPWLIPVLIIAAIFLIAGVIISQAILPQERVYREGTLLIAEGKYEDAILKLIEISSYRDSKQQIRRAKSLQAEEYLVLDDYDNAMSLFTELSGKEYASERINKRKKVYEQLHPATPEPTADIKTPEKAPMPTQEPILVQTELQKKLASVSQGDIITFGRYEQDGNEDNGPEEIEWIVLENNNSEMLLLSKYGIEFMGMSQINKSCSGEYCLWENTIVRKWLNSDFINSSFNNDEKAIIQDTKLSPVNNSYIGTHSENSTNDQIFLLDLDEVNYYLPDNNKRIVLHTPKLEKEMGTSSNWWWLRSPGSKIKTYDEYTKDGRKIYDGFKNDTLHCTYVSYDGHIDIDGFECNARGLIRPAMKINLTPVEAQSIDSYFRSETSMVAETDLFFSNKQIGDVIHFGSYEQDGNDTNGKEPIYWIVLEKQNDRMLLISKNIISWREYQSKNETLTWENCDLRKWLNKDFIDEAFTIEQQELLFPSEIFTPDITVGNYVFHDGTTVTDRCFLLSYEEIDKYFDRNNRSISNQDNNHYGYSQTFWFVRSGSLHINSKRTVQIYLRGEETIIDDNTFVPIINDKGNLQYVIAYQRSFGVRPAIWIKL